MARMNPGAVLVLVILLLVLFNPSASPPSKAEQQHARAVVASERQKLQVLQNSTFGDFHPGGNESKWLDLPGFEEKHGLKWHLLDRVQERAKEQARYVAGSDWDAIYNGQSNSTLLLYHNVSGVAHGKWVRSNVGEDLYPVSVNLTALLPPGVEYLSSIWRRNITGPEGKLSLHLTDESVLRKPKLHDQWIRDISGRITIQDETSHADGWASAVYGVHYVASGAILLTTTSEKFAGIFGVPHLAFSAHSFNVSKGQTELSINQTINQQEADRDESDNPWSSNIINADEEPVSPMCELIVYAQQHLIPPNDLGMKYRADDDSQAVLELAETELRFPEGRKVPHTPTLSMSAVIFSPDCGFVLESKGPPDYSPALDQHLRGLKVEARIENTKNILSLFSLLLIAQLYVLVLEIKRASTPARRSRISFYSITMLSLGSGVVAFGFLFLSGLVVSLFVPALIVAFLGFMDGLFFAMKFLMEIWSAQEPERLELERRRDRARAAARSVTPNEPQSSPTSGNDSGLPLPVTHPVPLDTGATAVMIPSDQDTTQGNPATAETRTTTFGAVYTRYCLVLLTIVFFSIWAASSATLGFRTAYTNTIFFVYLSFWIPQIHRNILRNGRKALTARFVLSQTIMRPLPIAYFYAIKSNVLFVETDVRTLLVYATWLWIQVLVLAGQEILGPRFLVSEKWSWVPTAWDYHPVLREDEEGAMMPIGYNVTSPVSSRRSTAAGEAGPSTLGSSSARKAGAGGKGMRIFDCAICMQEIEAPVVPSHTLDPTAAAMMAAGSSAAVGGAPGFLARREYMVTPCRHIFHSACLEHWIGYRLQCPICRETLPPL